jgi:hypothetical protein
MSSFANTNETKAITVPEKTNVTTIADDTDCYLVRITEQWVEQNGPENDPNSYTIRYRHTRFIVCID